MSADESCKQFGFGTLPEGAEAIREDEFERLPEYVVELIKESSQGKLADCTQTDLHHIVSSYFENCVKPIPRFEEVDHQSEDVKNECASGSDPVSAGEVSSSE